MTKKECFVKIANKEYGLSFNESEANDFGVNENTQISEMHDMIQDYIKECESEAMLELSSYQQDFDEEYEVWRLEAGY